MSGLKPGGTAPSPCLHAPKGLPNIARGDTPGQPAAQPPGAAHAAWRGQMGGPIARQRARDGTHPAR